MSIYTPVRTMWIASMLLALSVTAAHAAGDGVAQSSREAYAQSMGRMHDAMMDGIAHDDADVAFAAGMLAHHEGAVEMARIQLEHGQDETLRELAQAIITAQEAEIRVLRAWLATHAPHALHEAAVPASGHAH
ncbi:hypothetical protein AAV94_13955 [Lampropedia cohaerens]|uniref:DUF305 domain-containing protein n=1 Tax=Lampropedia cohaerens TaxID=1610491 RepID=A0A0U1PWM1_9BURK|nr:DUF305 domain-containing protein [Lampropedia cohaerens]KKW66837.1 hypothetical protein AAV94_13955 [Lampropedia cohaerens]